MLVNVFNETERLWDDYAWPFLRLQRDIAISDGQQYYNLPSDMVFERIERVEFKHGDYWEKVEYSVGAAQYNQRQRQGCAVIPDQQFDAHEGNRSSLAYPIRDSDTATKQGMLRFHGIRNLGGLVQETNSGSMISCYSVFGS